MSNAGGFTFLAFCRSIRLLKLTFLTDLKVSLPPMHKQIPFRIPDTTYTQ